MIKLHRNLLCLFCFFAFFAFANAQSVLSIEEVRSAIKENNYDLKAARQNIRSAEVLNSKYNSGYMPTLGVDAGLGYSLNGIKSTFNFNFPDIDIKNIQAYSGNIGIASSYILYDGGQRKLQNQKNQTNLDYAHIQVDNLQQLLEFNALQLYYRIGQTLLNLDLLEETLAISKERSKRARALYEYGRSTRVDLSNVKVDIVRDSLNLITVNNDIENLKWQLNQLTLKENTDYTVDTSFTLAYSLLDKGDLQEQMLQSNKELNVLRKNEELIQYDLAISSKLNTPQLFANGAYNINYQKNSPNSQQDFSRNNGLNLGLSFNWNILDGGQRKVQEQLAMVSQTNASIDVLNKENELISRFNQLWNSYKNSLLILELEKQNIETNKENFELVKSLFANGQQTSLEFRQAQLNLLNAQSQYLNARVSAKILEVEMDFLLGK